MPGKARPGKAKTHSGAKKRARKTGTGKVRMQKSSNSHIRFGKSKRQLNMAGNLQVLAKGDAANLKKLLD